MNINNNEYNKSFLIPYTILKIIIDSDRKLFPAILQRPLSRCLRVESEKCGRVGTSSGRILSSLSVPYGTNSKVKEICENLLSVQLAILQQ